MGNLDPKDLDRGLYQKFNVSRVDGSSEAGERHENCQYFVLDLDHDPNALPAIKAYAKACRKDHPLLADDLDEWISANEF